MRTCPACGSYVPHPQARFCPACGTELPVLPGSEEGPKHLLGLPERVPWYRTGLGMGVAASAVVAGAVTAVLIVSGGEGRGVAPFAPAIVADRLGCTGVQDLPDEGVQHLAPGEPPPDYGSTPATSGTHSGVALPPEPRVYEQPFDASIETQAVHNLEHAYVIIYYRQDGDDALPRNVVDSLALLAMSEEKVILAPYPDLAEGQSLALVAWTHLQTCPRVDDADAVTNIAKDFINRFRGGGDAPEPLGT